MILIATHANAITIFTVNGQTEIELRPEERRLLFEADTNQPGNALTLELYIDGDGDGGIDPRIDLNLLAYVEGPTITDGGPGYLRDEDGMANGHIQFEVAVDNILPGFPTTGFILRAVDADGSSADIILRTILPEVNQSISGRITSESGGPIEGIMVVAMANILYFEGPIVFPEPIKLPVPIREPDSYPVPILTVTGADGNYQLPTQTGSILVTVLSRPGYYAPARDGLINQFDSTLRRVIEVLPDENKTGVDFTLAEDQVPPTIEHEPPQEAVIINSPVRLRAKITDGESGIGRFGFGIFGSSGGGATLFFRPAGSEIPFRRRTMYPTLVDILPLPPVPFPLPNTDILTDEMDQRDGGEPGREGFENDVDAGGKVQIGLPGIDLPLSPIGFPPKRSNFEFYEARLSGSDVGATGVEYYISASDGAGNRTTHPSDVRAMLHHIGVKPSDYIVSGSIRTPDDSKVEGVTVFAQTAARRFSEIHTVQTESLADGTYILHLPTAGKWRVAIAPPPKFFFPEPEQSRRVVEVTAPGVYAGVDFTIAADREPPVIDHQSGTDVTAASIGDDVIIKARIRDNSSRVHATLITLPIDSEGERPADAPLHRFLPYAIPSVENDTDWTFRIPGEVVASDFAYFIQAFDRVGNQATHPENPEENPHRVILQPSPYRIVGAVTDTEGNPVPQVRIVFSRDGQSTADGPEPSRVPPGGETMVIRVPVFRHVETGTDGRFSIPVKPGLWEVQVVRRGFVLREEILPITIESEGDYELNVMLIADNEPPIIVHQPSGGYTFGEPMIVEAQVTDNHEVRGVAVRLFREFVEDTVIFAEGKMDVEGEIGSAEAGADLEIGSDAPPPPVTPVKEEEGAEVEPARPQILDPSFSPIFDDAIDVPIASQTTSPRLLCVYPDGNGGWHELSC